MIRRTVRTLALIAMAHSSIALCTESAKDTPEWKPSLLAADAPAQKPWEDGATFAHSSVDGKATTVADAVFKLERISDSRTSNGFSRVSWGPGLYDHRNTDAKKPSNDRGVLLSAAGLWFDDGPAEGARQSWNWSVDAKAGKTLTPEEVGGQKSYYDKDSRRVTVGGQYVIAPSVGLLDPSNVKQHPYMFFTVSARTYMDRISGGVTNASGRLTGVEAMVRMDVAPLGLDPASTKIGGTGLGFVPSFAAWGQRQHDFSSSGVRTKGNRDIWGIKAQLSFEQLDSSGVVPALSLERSKGADLLAGREESAITKIALSIKY